MSKLVITSIGPASSVQDGGRPGSQRYGLVPSGAMDRLALAAANTLVGNELFAAVRRNRPVRRGVHRARRRGAHRAVGRVAQRRHRRASGRDRYVGDAGRWRDADARFCPRRLLQLSRDRRRHCGRADFGSLAVNARAGLGSPYPRPLQAGDELQTAKASGAAEQRIELPAAREAPIRVVWGPQDDEFSDDSKKLFLDSEWKISATSDRMGYRLEGPVIKHLHGHNIVSDGTVNGSMQVPGNGQPIVLMPDRGTSGGYPKIATVISADFGRFAQTPAGRAFRFKAVSMAEAQAEARQFAELLRTLPDRLRGLESFDLNIEALQRCQRRRPRRQRRRCGDLAGRIVGGYIRTGLRQNPLTEADQHHDKHRSQLRSRRRIWRMGNGQ